MLASEQFDSMVAHLAATDVDTSGPTLALGDIIRMDPRSDTCVGPNAAAAGALARRGYREPFVLPDWQEAGEGSFPASWRSTR